MTVSRPFQWIDGLEQLAMATIWRIIGTLVNPNQAEVSPSKWIEWGTTQVQRAKLDTIRDTLLTRMPVKYFESLLGHFAQLSSSPKVSRVLALFYLALFDGATELAVPGKFQMDGRHRLLCLQWLDDKYPPNLKVLSFRCYEGGQAWYNSPRELSLLQSIVGKGEELEKLTLNALLTPEVAQSVCQRCSNLVELDISHNANILVRYIDHLFGVKTRIKRDHICEDVLEPTPQCAFSRTLRVFRATQSLIWDSQSDVVRRMCPNLEVLELAQGLGF